MDDRDSRYDAQRLALSRALALAGITATLTLPLGFLARSIAPDPINVPLISADGRGYYLLALFVALVVAALAQLLETDDVARQQYELGWQMHRPGDPPVTYRPPPLQTAWMLPLVTLVTAYLLLAVYHRISVIVFISILTAGTVLAARMVRYHVMNTIPEWDTAARLGHVVLTHGLAYFTLTAVYMFKARTLFAGVLILALGFLLLVQLTDGVQATQVKRMLYAAIGALGLAEVAWALSYWNMSAWIGGAMLVAMFVFVAGVVRSQLRGELTQRRLVEVLAVAAPIFAVLAYLAE